MEALLVGAGAGAAVAAGLLAKRQWFFAWPMYLASSLMLVWARDAGTGAVVPLRVTDVGLAPDSHDLLPADIRELTWDPRHQPEGAVFLTSGGSFTARFAGSRVRLEKATREEALAIVAAVLAGIGDGR
ncbi:hypothetical protein [Streptomyces pacificus]|uniref:Uncharacterized protein n=1 Tax=Streptomyces pacificus TaxID=2705029 RepID=A0A6A0ATB9_9ACTN|nr:hypothetical protein [Streptomyces pacificus]GFH35938.1 hypothetical protein SCWH03_21600 [Streptomyces pacificus]